MFRKFLLFVLALLLIPTAYIGVVSFSHADLSALPALESGDLIFESVVDRQQTLPIMVATGSIYTHVGIIHKTANGYTVVHAVQPVSEIPLKDFIKFGWGERFTIRRYPDLTPAQREAIIIDAESYLGRGYNFVFSMKSNAIYCSELPYLVFERQRLPLGTLQKIGDLNMNNPITRRLFSSRWHYHPDCQKPGETFDSCWKTMLEEPIITPVSLARDPKLTLVYSNYLF